MKLNLKLVATALALILGLSSVAACDTDDTPETSAPTAATTTEAEADEPDETDPADTETEEPTESEQSDTETTPEGTETETEPEDTDPSETRDPAFEGDPLKITMFYSDNATLPFREDWLTVTTAEEWYNTDITWEIIPIADYSTRVSLALNTGQNAPDVILYQSTSGENSSLALNGAIVPISDYSDWTPHFNGKVEEFNLQDNVDLLNLQDGKRYYQPALFDQPFYDGGLILREDMLEAHGFEAPKTFDDLYDILTSFKEENPDSYPLTILAGPRVLYRMTMPSFGISVGPNGAGGSNVLSWDYENEEYFAGATSEEYREYMRFFSKLYEEGLLDPEMADPIDGDRWAQKLATGDSFATYAYYDQIGGVEGAATEEGFKLQMYPPLEGPAGAHHQQKNPTGAGMMFPKGTAERDDFERIVRTMDAMFFSDEAALLWGIGVEGTTYTMEGDEIVYADDILEASDGVYKYMQVQYGAGSDVTQQVWAIEREMTKYDENYSRINQEVAGMDNAIQYIPPTPQFDDLTAEEASSYQTPLADTFNVWADGFLTGRDSIEDDWDAYVAEMEALGIENFLNMYNENLGN